MKENFRELKKRLNCNLTGHSKIQAGLEERYTFKNITLQFLNFKDKKKILQVTRKNNYLTLKNNQINIEPLICNAGIDKKKQ